MLTLPCIGLPGAAPVRRERPPGQRRALQAFACAAGALLVAVTPGAAADRAARVMAITMDDLPAVRSSVLPVEQQALITARILDTLSRHRVPAVGFVNESKLEHEGRLDPARVMLLDAWLAAGLELGNHGYAHLDLHEVEPSAWLADVLDGERVIRPLMEARGSGPRWFRHPYLHAGRSADLQHAVEAFLAAHGYRVAPVTIDNGDWIYARAYAAALARDDGAGADSLGADYVAYMLDVVAYYERQADAILGRALPHVLLVHANALNADWLGVLLERLETSGYGWVALEAALADPAYEQAIDGYTGPGGISWLHRWALTQGMEPSVFRGEPEVPDWVENWTTPHDVSSTSRE